MHMCSLKGMNYNYLKIFSKEPLHVYATKICLACSKLRINSFDHRIVEAFASKTTIHYPQSTLTMKNNFNAMLTRVITQTQSNVGFQFPANKSNYSLVEHCHAASSIQCAALQCWTVGVENAMKESN